MGTVPELDPLDLLWLTSEHMVAFSLHHFRLIFDSSTYFPRPFSRVHANITARVPMLIGVLEDDGSFFTITETNITTFLRSSLSISGELVANWQEDEEDMVRSLYPGLSDAEVMSKAFRDVAFTW